MFRLFQRTLHLHLLFVAQRLIAYIFKRYTACMVMFQLLAEVHAIKVENGGGVCWYTMLSLAVIEESTAVRFHAVF